MFESNLSSKYSFSDAEIEKEADRLFAKLMNVSCNSGRTWNYEECMKIAAQTLRIKTRKKELNAVIMAHTYVVPEIIFGVSDYNSDSYALALEASKLESDVILFAGVRFMAETAKLVNPNAKVLLPDFDATCSLAESINAKQVEELRAKYPNSPVVCYINSSAEVKAASDVCVTSGNVYKIVENLEADRIIFIPDRLMAENVRIYLKEKGINKEIIASDGTCFVHDRFDHNIIDRERQIYPGLKVLSHPECNSDVTQHSDYVGSTGKMIDYVKNSDAKYFMMLTECGLVSKIEVEYPDKEFVASCKLCPYMKMNTLDKIEQVLFNPRADQIIEVAEPINSLALKSIHRMFEIAAM